MKAAVPEAAVARLRKLEQRVSAMRSEYRDLQEQFQHARAEAGRLEGVLQNPPYASGRRLEVDELGVFYREQRGGSGVRRAVGFVTRTDPSDGHETFRYVDDPALAATGRSIIRLRHEVADLSSRRDALAEKIHPLAALVDACRRELERRGWQEGECATVQQGTALRGAA